MPTKIERQLNYMRNNMRNRIGTIQRDKKQVDRNFNKLVRDIEGVLSIVGNKIGRLSDRFMSYYEELKIAAQYFYKTNAQHDHIAMCYTGLSDKLQLIADDVQYMVTIFKDHYPQLTPEDQEDGWHPDYVTEPTSVLAIGET